MRFILKRASSGKARPAKCNHLFETEEVQRTKTKRKERDGPHANAEIVRGAHTSHRTSLVLVVPRESFWASGVRNKEAAFVGGQITSPDWPKSVAGRNETGRNQTKRSEAKRSGADQLSCFIFSMFRVRVCVRLCSSVDLGL